MEAAKGFQRPTHPHFFQPLLPNFLTNFSIPKSFCKYLEEEGGNAIENKIAKLRDKRGKVWHVKVVNTVSGTAKRSTVLKDGWKKFCKDHDLHVGDFLVFRLEGKFVFEVLIFDPTACERQFASSKDDVQHSSSSHDVDDGIETTSFKSPSTSAVLEEVMAEKENSIKKAAFQPSGRPFFSAIVRPSLMKSSRMAIPSEFAKKYGLSKRWCKMVLIDEKGQPRSMILRYDKRWNDCTYIGGWTRYAHSLKSGDRVNLELIDSGEKPVMKLLRGERILPSFDSTNGVKASSLVGNANKPSKNNEKGVGKVLSNGRASFEPSGYPYCRMIVQQYWEIRGEVYLPKEFKQKNGLLKPSELKVLDQNGRTWALSLVGCGKSAHISGGRPFIEANGLKTGDPVIFELIHNGEKPFLKFYSAVSIQK